MTDFPGRAGGGPRRSVRPLTVPLGVLVLGITGVVGVTWGERTELPGRAIRLSDAGEWGVLLAASAAWVAAAALVFARTARDGNRRRAFRKAALLQVALTTALLLLLSRGEAVLPGGSAGGQPGLPALPRGRLEVDLPLNVVVIGLVVTAAAAAVLLVLLTALGMRPRYGRLAGTTWRERRFGRGRRTPAEPETLREALARARRALGTDDDARRAVIAAYAAMESAIEAHGLRRRVSDTAGEFLHDALASRVLRSRRAATGLLDLFHAARFSHEAMPPDALPRVRDHLDTLESDLRVGSERS
ncbi:MAG: DUF4129 domain-containing protein [Propionibacteriales bacterium]|nr:DUF4129 domain-containing protein [Propionibacteriales bacterium]